MGAQCGKEQGTYQPFGTSDDKTCTKNIGLQFTSQETNSWNPENHLLEKENLPNQSFMTLVAVSHVRFKGNKK